MLAAAGGRSGSSWPRPMSCCLKSPAASTVPYRLHQLHSRTARQLVSEWVNCSHVPAEAFFARRPQLCLAAVLPCCLPPLGEMCAAASYPREPSSCLCHVSQNSCQATRTEGPQFRQFGDCVASPWLGWQFVAGCGWCLWAGNGLVRCL